jgi:hypothetical protein
VKSRFAGLSVEIERRRRAERSTAPAQQHVQPQSILPERLAWPDIRRQLSSTRIAPDTGASLSPAMPWAATIPGLGPMRTGAFTACVDCPDRAVPGPYGPVPARRGVWTFYGDVPLCRTHAWKRAEHAANENADRIHGAAPENRSVSTPISIEADRR